jgi:hypothetical protein
MKTHSRFHTFTLQLLLSLVFVSEAPGLQVYLLAQDACPPQWNFRSQLEYPFDPNDPNSPAGFVYRSAPILGPGPAETFDPNDGSAWMRPVGKLVRTGTVCLEAGWVMEAIVVLESTGQMTATWDTSQASWTLSGDTLLGPNWCIVRASNRYANSPKTIVASRTVCVVWFGTLDRNSGPVLSSIAQWLNAG